MIVPSQLALKNHTNFGCTASLATLDKLVDRFPLPPVARWSSDQNSGIAEADKMAKRTREEPEEFPEEQAPTTGRMLKKEATRAAKERWQTEWDQGEKGRMTHSIIREVDRKLRGWNHKAVCLLTGHGPFRG
jgi:hypothetical protein